MSGFLTSLPADVVLDAGVLSINGSTFGVSRGGVRWSSNEEWQNIRFDGWRSPIALLDRKVSDEQTIEATFIEMSKAKSAIYLNHGGIAGMASLTVAQAAALSVAQAASYSAFGDGTPQNASQLCTQGQYAVNVRVTWLQGDGTTAYVNFALAYVAEWRMVGKEKDAAEISCVFKARNDFVTSSSTDAAIHTIALTS